MIVGKKNIIYIYIFITDLNYICNHILPTIRFYHNDLLLCVISILKPTRCASVSNLFYFGMTLYMFRTFFPSIIRSSRLYIQRQAFVKKILLSAC